MEDKEYLVLKFLSRFDAPISYNDLETGLKDHFDKHQKENLLYYLSNLEFKGWLDDNYLKGVQITDTGKKQLLNGRHNGEEDTGSRRKKKRIKPDEDQKASNFVYRTYWLMFAFSIIAFVLSLLSLLFWFFPGLLHALFP